MKIFKGLTVLVITLTLGSCFDPPEFPTVPKIEFRDLDFKEANVQNGNDSLILRIDFQDGDGDLGVDAAAPEFNSAPYNNLTLYQTNDADKVNLIPINTIALNVDHLGAKDVKQTTPVNLLQIEDPSKGTLVFARTRKRPGYGFLPEYRDCEPYQLFRTANYAVEAKNKAVLDKAVTVDTLFSKVNGIKTPTHFLVRDTLYFSVNKNHYNIDVDFLIKDPSNPNADELGFVEYSFRKEFCQQDLGEGRFPILTDNVGPLEGTIRYGMNSIGLRRIFTIKTMKLRVRVRDRALNESNTIVTNEFTLDQI